MEAYDASRNPGFVVDGGVTSTGALGFGSGADVVASIGKKQRELENGFVASRTDKYAGFDSEIGCNAAGRVLDKDGGEFNTVGKQGAHDYSKTEAGRFILEEKRKFEAAKAAMSETRVRDADGTVDRIDDSVAKALMPILFTVKERCRVENIELEAIFERAGGTHFGTIKRQNFQSTLVNNFKRLLFEEETLIALVTAYGCGYKHPGNPVLNIPALYEHVGWKDFCEDVGKAYDTTYGVATEMAKVRGAWVSPIKLGMKADLVEGWDPSSSAPLIALSDSPDTEIAIQTNVNPETVLAAPGSIDGRGSGPLAAVSGSALKVAVQGRRATHPPLKGKKFRKTGRDQFGEMLLDLIEDKAMVRARSPSRRLLILAPRPLTVRVASRACVLLAAPDDEARQDHPDARPGQEHEPRGLRGRRERHAADGGGRGRQRRDREDADRSHLQGVQQGDGHTKLYQQAGRPRRDRLLRGDGRGLRRHLQDARRRGSRPEEAPLTAGVAMGRRSCEWEGAGREGSEGAAREWAVRMKYYVLLRRVLNERQIR